MTNSLTGVLPVVTVILAFAGLGATLSGAPAFTREAQNPTIVESGPRVSIEPDEALDVSDVPSVVRKWGIRIEGIRITAAGYMLDFRYTVVDTRKAKPLFERRIKPVLTDEASGAVLEVPVPPKTGALRNTYDPKMGKTYFMFFGNAGRRVRPGSLVTVTIGKFRVSHIKVEADDLQGVER
jgi:hypothetical protein